MTGRRLSVRDYKGPRREGLSSGWLRPFALGLALGLAIAAVVFVQTRHHFLMLAAASATADAVVAPASSVETHAARRTTERSATSQATPAAPGSPQADSASGNARVAADGASAAGPGSAPAGGALPKFDFYQMLPRSQVLIPAHESETHLAAGAPLERPGTYFLQIGSYRDAAVAERVRAQVEKLGVTVSVQRIVVDAATWHRVRVGPIRDLAVLNRLRHQLQAGNLQAMIVRVTP